MTAPLAAAVGFGVAATATPPAARLARRLGIVDHPGELKVHTTPVAYLGGVGLAAGLVAGVLAAGVQPRRLAPTLLALGLGVADDARSLRPATRLAAEIAVGTVAAAVSPTRLPVPVGPLAVGAATVGLVNAVNLLDGLDGLAGGLTIASAAGLAGLLDGPVRGFAAALSGAAAGFLVHNLPPARVYLGDGGAYAVGATLATLVAAAWAPQRPSSAAWAANLTVALPAVEVAAALVRRRRAGQPWSVGDRRHSYDLLAARGWGRGGAAAALVAAQAALSTIAIGAARRPGPVPALAALIAGTATWAGATLAVGSFDPAPAEEQP